MVGLPAQHEPPGAGPVGEAGQGRVSDHPERGPAPLQGGQQECDRVARNQQSSCLYELLLQSAKDTVPEGTGTCQSFNDSKGSSNK